MMDNLLISKYSANHDYLLKDTALSLHSDGYPSDWYSVPDACLSLIHATVGNSSSSTTDSHHQSNVKASLEIKTRLNVLHAGVGLYNVKNGRRKAKSEEQYDGFGLFGCNYCRPPLKPGNSTFRQDCCPLLRVLRLHASAARCVIHCSSFFQLEWSVNPDQPGVRFRSHDKNALLLIAAWGLSPLADLRKPFRKTGPQ